MSLGLIQGHDTIPQEIAALFGKEFTDLLPGWTVNGFYNFQPAGKGEEKGTLPF